jgi:phosphoglycolate phosphatase
LRSAATGHAATASFAGRPESNTSIAQRIATSRRRVEPAIAEAVSTRIRVETSDMPMSAHASLIEGGERPSATSVCRTIAHIVSPAASTGKGRLTRACRQAIHRPPMKKRAVLFDLDGTLLDTLQDLADAVNAALAALGFPSHPLEAYRYFVGDGVETLMRRALPAEAARDGVLLARAVDLQRTEYRNRWHAKTRPYPGIPQMLAELERRLVRMAILSNKPDAFVDEMVRYFLPGVRFEVARGARPGVPVKPDPGSALQVAAEMGVRPAEVLYLGDTNTDMLTALGAGMKPVGALWGFRTERELRESGATELIARPMDFVDLLRS